MNCWIKFSSVYWGWGDYEYGMWISYYIFWFCVFSERLRYWVGWGVLVLDVLLYKVYVLYEDKILS